jgi:hypothetical protein
MGIKLRQRQLQGDAAAGHYGAPLDDEWFRHSHQSLIIAIQKMIHWLAYLAVPSAAFPPPFPHAQEPIQYTHNCSWRAVWPNRMFALDIGLWPAPSSFGYPSSLRRPAAGFHRSAFLLRAQVQGAHCAPVHCFPVHPAFGARRKSMFTGHQFPVQPLPRVLVLFGLASFSMKAMIWPAISFLVAFSMPSRPGEEFTSMTTGP